MRTGACILIVALIVFSSCCFFSNEALCGTGNTDAMIVTSEEIQKMNVYRVHDILNKLPGIRASESSVSIHGSTKVKVLLDGRPINDPTSSHGFVKFDLVPVDEIDRIEIHRGKGAVKYGRDASGGVILIYTKKISSFHGNGRVYWGNFDTSSYSANVRFKKKRFGVRFSSGYEYTDGYQINGDKEKFRVGLKGIYSVMKDLEASFSTDYLNDKRGLSGRPEYPTPHSRKEYEIYSCSASINAPHVKSESFFNHAITKNTDPDRSIDYSIKVREFGEDISFLFDRINFGSFSIGGAFRWGEASSTGFDTKDETSFSVFASHLKKFNQIPVSISYGMRLTHYSEFKDSLDPEVEVSCGKQNWSFSVSYSQNNNTPSFYQRYNKTSTKEPNPDLDKEISHNLSAMFSVRFSPELSCSTTFFYNWITDRITYVLGDDGIGRYENFGKVTYKGIDFQTKWQILKNLGIRFNYSFLRAIDEKTGLWLVAKPEHTIYADVTYSPFRGLSLIGSAKYESKQYTRSDNKSSVPPRAIGNLRIEYLPDLKALVRKVRLEIFSEIRNISDERYLYGDGWLAPPLIWICGLNCVF